MRDGYVAQNDMNLRNMQVICQINEEDNCLYQSTPQQGLLNITSQNYNYQQGNIGGAPPRSSLCIKLPQEASPEEFKAYMSKYQGLTICCTDHIFSKGIALCKFAKSSLALQAMEDIQLCNKVGSYKVQAFLFGTQNSNTTPTKEIKEYGCQENRELLNSSMSVDDNHQKGYDGKPIKQMLSLPSKMMSLKQEQTSPSYDMLSDNQNSGDISAENNQSVTAESMTLLSVPSESLGHNGSIHCQGQLSYGSKGSTPSQGILSQGSLLYSNNGSLYSLLSAQSQSQEVQNKAFQSMSNGNGTIQHIDKQRLFYVVSKDATQQEIYELFNKFEGLAHYELKSDKKTGLSKGYGYVLYSTAEVASQVISKLNQIQFPENSGYQLKVMYAEAPQKHKISQLSNLQRLQSQTSQKSSLESFPNPHSLYNQPRLSEIAYASPFTNPSAHKQSKDYQSPIYNLIQNQIQIKSKQVQRNMQGQQFSGQFNNFNMFPYQQLQKGVDNSEIQLQIINNVMGGQNGLGLPQRNLHENFQDYLELQKLLNDQYITNQERQNAQQTILNLNQELTQQQQQTKLLKSQYSKLDSASRFRSVQAADFQDSLFDNQGLLDQRNNTNIMHIKEMTQNDSFDMQELNQGVKSSGVQQNYQKQQQQQGHTVVNTPNLARLFSQQLALKGIANQGSVNEIKNQQMQQNSLQSQIQSSFGYSQDNSQGYQNIQQTLTNFLPQHQCPQENGIPSEINGNLPRHLDNLLEATNGEGNLGSLVLLGQSSLPLPIYNLKQFLETQGTVDKVQYLGSKQKFLAYFRDPSQAIQAQEKLNEKECFGVKVLLSFYSA